MPASPAAPEVPPHDRRTVASGVLFGCGLAASMVDLLVFHLLLQWHHLYDLSTTGVGLAADAALHAVSFAVTVWGLVLLVDVRRRGTFDPRRWAAAVGAGVGGFQLFDGVVNHKLLRIHQVRDGVDLLPYDVAWIGSAVLLLGVGLVALHRTRPGRPQTGARVTSTAATSSRASGTSVK